MGCNLDPAKDVADCTGTFISDGTRSIFAEVNSGYTDYIVPLTVTAGVEKLSGVAGQTTEDGASSTGTATGPSNTLTTPAAPTEPASTTSTSTGGVPRVTQNAVVLGAAALVGGAMMI